MIIKKLELQGFKSFAEKTKIIFHSGITSIVGPNGTGKSNIVDALIWTLGGKKLKSLRGERSENVIFNGNTQRPPLGMADVVLHLGNKDEQWTINHRIYRSGESEYRLNGKPVRLKDIQDFLWKQGVGEKEYFVIEQGSIGVFLSSKPVEKRALLEDAAGTAYYKDKKRQAQNKLENSEQNLDRLEDIISEVSKSKNSLQRQAQAARRYRKLREKTRHLSLLLYRKKIENLEKNHQEADQNYQKILQQENNVLRKLKEEEKKLNAKRKEVWIVEKEIQGEQQNIFTLKSQLSRTETEKDKQKKRIDFFEEKEKRAQKDNKDLKEELINLNKEKTKLKEELNTHNQTLLKKQEELKQTEKNTQWSQQELNQWQEKIDTLRQEYFQKISEKTENKNQLTSIDKDIEIIQKQEQKNRSQIETETNLLKQKEKEMAQLEKEISLSRDELKKKKNVLEMNNNSLDQLNLELKKLDSQISDLYKTKDKHSHHLHALERLKEKQKGRNESSTPSKSVGLLAELMESDSAHTPLIDVFWKEEAKAYLISIPDFLSLLSQKKASGNFLLLSEQNKSSISPKVLNSPEVVGLLKTKVRSDKKIEPYFSQLEEAVIVKDLKSTVELWSKHPHFHYITLEGDVLYSSGLLKCGMKKEGIFTLTQEIKTVKKKIEETNEKITPLDSQLKEKSQHQKNLKHLNSKQEEEKEKLERKIQELERDKQDKQEEKEKISENISLFKQELNILKQEKSPLLKKREKIEKTIHQIEEKEKWLKQKLENREKQFGSLQKKFDQDKNNLYTLKSRVELLQEKIKNLKSQLQSIKERTQSIKIKQSSLEQEIQTSQEDQKKAEQSIGELEKKIQTLEKNKDQKESLLKQKESQLKVIQEEEKEMEERMESLREQRDERKEERVKWEIKKAERERDLANLEESCWQELKKSPEEIKKEISLESTTLPNIEESLSKAQQKLQKFNSVNFMAEEEYESQKKRYEFLTQQKKDLRESISSTREAIRKIDQESKNQFLKALDEVNQHFSEVFSLLFQGGKAELSLTHPHQPLESGIEITAQPPGKKVQNLNLLSGGEKSLTSLAFFFALFRYRPIPFCILDEVDAGLDEANLVRFLNLMKQIKNQTQFLLITHNFKTMEVSDYIYGTTMAEPNITQVYSLQLDKKKLEQTK